MDEPSVADCFRLLGLKRGCDMTAVKQAYRKNLYKCHPDRFQNRPEMLPEAERKAKRLIQVYGILERWYESNGGTDPVPPFGAPEEPADDVGFGTEDDEGLRSYYRPWMRYAGAALLVLLLYTTWTRYFEPTAPVARGIPGAATPSASRQPEAAPTQAAPATDIDALKAAVAARAAELRQVAEARDRNRDEWAKGYLGRVESELAAAKAELAQAEAQYQRDVKDSAPDIAAAEGHASAIRAAERAQSDASKTAYARDQEAGDEALRTGYNEWLLGRGKEAVALIRQIRTRDNSAFGVFANTEDPSKIFEFWTAGEAGAPEINIAAKTGVTVLQPDDRYFPHFRSNIFLHDTEGKQLVAMMESIIERHDALGSALAARKLARDDALSNWDARHPLPPVNLPAAQASVLRRRDDAEGRLSAARARYSDAVQAHDSPSIDAAFGQSGSGREWEERYLAAMAGLSAARRSLADAQRAR